MMVIVLVVVTIVKMMVFYINDNGVVVDDSSAYCLVVMVVMVMIVILVLCIHRMINSNAIKAMLSISLPDYQYKMKYNVHLLTALLNEENCVASSWRTKHLYDFPVQIALFFVSFLKIFSLS